MYRPNKYPGTANNFGRKILIYTRRKFLSKSWGFLHFRVCVLSKDENANFIFANFLLTIPNLICILAKIIINFIENVWSYIFKLKIGG